jgi:hypothetical protein
MRPVCLFFGPINDQLSCFIAILLALPVAVVLSFDAMGRQGCRWRFGAMPAGSHGFP